MNIKLSEKFHRVIISSPNLLTKKYKYKNVFQLLPPNKKWYRTDFVQINYPLILEFNSSFQREYNYKNEVNTKKKAALDLINEFDTSTFNFKKELIYLLTVFSFCFFQDNINLGKHNRAWYGEKYFISDFQTRNIDQVTKDEIYKCFDENKLMGYEIKFPMIIGDLLDQYFLFSGEILDVTRRAILLFYKSFEIAPYSYSMSLVSMISAIEAIIRFENSDIENEICKECKNIKYRITKQFNDFLIKYSGENNKRKKKKYINYLYDLRSKVVHNGFLFYTDYSFDSEDNLLDIRLENIRYFLIHCFMNWIILKE